MSPDRRIDALVGDELDVPGERVPMAGQDVIELGCGAAKLARSLLARVPSARSLRPAITMLPLAGQQRALLPLLPLLPDHRARMALFDPNTGVRDDVVCHPSVGMRLPEAGVPQSTVADIRWPGNASMTHHDSVAQIVEPHATLANIKEDTGRWNKSLATLRREHESA